MKGPLVCPVEGCQDWEVRRVGIWVHFIHHHIWDTVVIL